jgi:DNA-binding PadR family transcriptional regulator
MDGPTAEILILALVDEQDLHGCEIVRRIDQRSSTLQFTLASRYCTLCRLEKRGRIRGRRQWVSRDRSGRPPSSSASSPIRTCHRADRGTRTGEGALWP